MHHGNGTQDAFYDDPSVLFVSLHQYPFYPGTGAPNEIGRGAGRGLHGERRAAQRPGARRRTAHAFARVVLPLLEQFAPDFVLVSAGFDAHRRDPLAEMQLDNESYGAMASALIAAAERSAAGRIAFLLEGGYDLYALRDSVASARTRRARQAHRRCRKACRRSGWRAKRWSARAARSRRTGSSARQHSWTWA